MTEPIDIAVDRNLRPLMPKFFAVRKDELGRIKAANAAGDFLALKRIGHTLHGTASSYGFFRLGEIGSQVEAAAGARDTSAIALLVTELEDHLERVRVRYV